MKSCLVSVDLKHPPVSYVLLHDQLRALSFEPLHGQLWAAPRNLDPEVVKATLVPHVRKGDGIFVFQHNPDTDDFASLTSR